MTFPDTKLCSKRYKIIRTEIPSCLFVTAYTLQKKEKKIVHNTKAPILHSIYSKHLRKSCHWFRI